MLLHGVEGAPCTAVSRCPSRIALPAWSARVLR
jgi:hypothetical protein